MPVLKEFREFVARGNVVDLAVGVIVGAAFGKITSSLVSDLVMPPIGLLLGGIDFGAKQLVLRHAVVDAAGKVTTPEVAIRYGQFIGTVIDFFLVAAAVFLLVQLVNRLRRKPPEAPGPTKTEALLTEIRDALATKA